MTQLFAIRAVKHVSTSDRYYSQRDNTIGYLECTSQSCDVALYRSREQAQSQVDSRNNGPQFASDALDSPTLSVEEFHGKPGELSFYVSPIDQDR